VFIIGVRGHADTMRCVRDGGQERAIQDEATDADGTGKDVADADSPRIASGRTDSRMGRLWESLQAHQGTGGRNQWNVEPDVGRVAHGIPARVDRLKGLGNAVVPQVAEWIALRVKAAIEAENYPVKIKEVK
jgi:DNA (cytosine-5)-methyltransferase 1